MLSTQANEAVEGLKVTGDKKAAADQIKALYKTFTDSDCTMVEVGTAVTSHSTLLASELQLFIMRCPSCALLSLSQADSILAAT